MYLKQLPDQQKPKIFQEVKKAFHGCLSNTTIHGLPQIVKPGNLFLNVVWVIFYAVAVSGCGFLIHQAVDQYFQYDVITMTKITREKEMTFPGITICSNDVITNMILECREPDDGRILIDCQMKKLTLHNRYGQHLLCIQFNYGTNTSELKKAFTEGDAYRYIITLYKHSDTSFKLAFTVNSAQVVQEEVRETIYPGQETIIDLSKTVQTVLGPPHSNCNQSTHYRQVTCIEDCDKKAIQEACGFGYEIGQSEWLSWASVLPERCRYAFNSRTLCYQECSVECKQVSFQTKRVDMEFDGDIQYYKSIVSRKFNISKYSDDELKRRITRLHVYFDKFETTEITQSPSISLTSLIANVGGLLGKSLYLPGNFMIHLIFIYSPFFLKACSLGSVFYLQLKPLIF